MNSHMCEIKSHYNVEPFFPLYVQEEDEVVVQTPEITQRVHHATDEEKLASTGIMGQTSDSQEEIEEPECNKAPAKKMQTKDIPVIDGMFGSSNPPVCRI